MQIPSKKQSEIMLYRRLSYLNEARDSLSKYLKGETLEDKIRNLNNVYYGIHYDYETKTGTGYWKSI